MRRRPATYRVRCKGCGATVETVLWPRGTRQYRVCFDMKHVGDCSIYAKQIREGGDPDDLEWMELGA